MARKHVAATRFSEGERTKVETAAAVREESVAALLRDAAVAAAEEALEDLWARNRGRRRAGGTERGDS